MPSKKQPRKPVGQVYGARGTQPPGGLIYFSVSSPHHLWWHAAAQNVE